MSDLTVNRVLKVILIAVILAMVAMDGDARSRVGVTTASDGDPLGKPPNENERILRIGIDVQANELVTTQAKDRAHLVFLDGSSLTVGPNARVVIDSFVYDPATNTGDLTINASRGVFRLVGGRISKQKPIVITTPASTIGIRGGITIVEVTPTGTVASFVFGKSMTVTARGLTQTATRSGSQVTTAMGGVPGTPSLLKQGALGSALGQLEGVVANSNVAADQSAQRSGFSRQNSGQPANVGPNGPPNLSNNTLVSAVSNSGLETRQATLPTTTVIVAPTIVPLPPSAPVAPPPPPTAGPPPPPPPLAEPSRTSQTLTGYAGGLVYGQRSPNLTNLLDKPGEISITTDATYNQAKGTIVVYDLTGSYRHPTTTTLQLGGTAGLGSGNSAFIDDKTYIMVTQYNDWSRLSSWQRGSYTRQATDTSVILSAGAGPVPLGLPLQSNPAPCVCEFLTWGWWASKVPDPRDILWTYTAVGAYVAGKPTTAVQLPQTGSATYTGFMAGVASSNGNTYAAGGAYQNAWNFGSRSGVFNGSFDGRGYSGTTQATAGSNGVAFTGSFAGGSRSGSLSGAFYASPTDPAKYQAGTFTIGNNSADYKATGVFAGQR